jgi:hypothetical protein
LHRFQIAPVSKGDDLAHPESGHAGLVAEVRGHSSALGDQRNGPRILGEVKAREKGDAAPWNMGTKTVRAEHPDAA